MSNEKIENTKKYNNKNTIFKHAYETKFTLESIKNVAGVWWDSDNNSLTHPMLHKHLLFTHCVANIILSNGNKRGLIHTFLSQIVHLTCKTIDLLHILTICLGSLNFHNFLTQKIQSL